MSNASTLMPVARPLLLLLPLLGSLALAPPPAAAQAGGAPPVTVAHPLQREVVDWDEFSGRFEAEKRITVQAQVSGILDAVHFTDGQIVEQGALLFVIDPRPYQAAVDGARAAPLRLAILAVNVVTDEQ